MGNAGEDGAGIPSTSASPLPRTRVTLTEWRARDLARLPAEQILNGATTRRWEGTLHRAAPWAGVVAALPATALWASWPPAVAFAGMVVCAVAGALAATTAALWRSGPYRVELLRRLGQEPPARLVDRAQAWMSAERGPSAVVLLQGGVRERGWRWLVEVRLWEGAHPLAMARSVRAPRYDLSSEPPDDLEWTQSERDLSEDESGEFAVLLKRAEDPGLVGTGPHDPAEFHGLLTVVRHYSVKQAPVGGAPVAPGSAETHALMERLKALFPASP
ncbi:MAG: hypothetical protein HY904_08815 [Deltaproteobacteria bacterium]|nr:hypothetical protein [Deltaproteobacteria bacterium]